MGKYCLTKNLAAKFKREIKKMDGDRLIEISKMSSQNRRAVFSETIGEANAKNVNALFEKKLGQKNFWNAMRSWAEESTGMKPPVKQDLISRIERESQRENNVLDPAEERGFMQDFASAKLGLDINYEEAQAITKLAETMYEQKEKFNMETKEWSSETDRLKYGTTRVALDELVAELKISTNKLTVKDYLLNPKEVLTSTAGTLKSLKASLDDSFFGRQGLKVLLNHPIVWSKNFAKSFADMGKALIKVDAIAPIKADVFSRPRAMAGDYARGKVAVGINSEEAFPSSLPERIPILGRLYKASESAYNGAALRMRADIADIEFGIAEKNEVDIQDKAEAEALGKLINSLTGRGSIGKLDSIGHELNVALFSIKFLKSNFDTLTAHQFDRKMTPYVRKRAAKNTVQVALSVAVILAVADWLWPESVDWDPRSSNFGKIKIRNTRFDVSGGMSSLITLAARVVPTRYEGEWGFWSKSSTTNKMTKLESGFGKRTALDVMWDFTEGKASPLLGIVRDKLKDEMFGGKEPTALNLAKGAVAPISIDTWFDLKNDPDSAPLYTAIMLELFGISVSNYSPTSFNNWNKSEGKELNALKDKIGQDKFNEANEEYNKNVDKMIIRLNKNVEFNQLSDDEKAKVVTKMKNKEKQKIFDKYDFEYERQTTPKNVTNKRTRILESISD